MTGPTGEDSDSIPEKRPDAPQQEHCTMSTTTTKSYVTFTAALIAKCTELGLSPLRDMTTESTLPENAGWAFLRFGDNNSAALIVPKSVTRMGNCHVHIDCASSPGVVPLPKKNGRVICHHTPDLELLMKHVVPRLPGASKRDVLPPTRKTPVTTPIVTLETTPATPEMPESPLVEWLTGDDSELEIGTAHA